MNGSRIERLEYEAFLEALHGLLNLPVVVIVNVVKERSPQPVAMMWGTLLAGAYIPDLGAEIEAEHLAGEAIVFYVGQSAVFIVRAADFKRGRREGNTLIYHSGRGEVRILPSIE